MKINANFWKERYDSSTIGWDTGQSSPPLVAFFDTLNNKDIKILIPGCGNAYEAEYLHKSGFTNVFILDYVKKPLQNLKLRCPSFPSEHLICADFFEHQGKYDLIIELAFFTAITPHLREQFVFQMSNLLIAKGKYVGLFFNHDFGNDYPPFATSPDGYKSLFEQHFTFEQLANAKNSIAQRAGQELFFVFQKKPAVGVISQHNDINK